MIQNSLKLLLKLGGFIPLVRTVGCVIKNLSNMGELLCNRKTLRSATDSCQSHYVTPGKECADFRRYNFMAVHILLRLFKQAQLLGYVYCILYTVYCMSHRLWVSSILVFCLSNNNVLFIFAPCIINI